MEEMATKAKVSSETRLDIGTEKGNNITKTHHSRPSTFLTLLCLNRSDKTQLHSHYAGESVDCWGAKVGPL
jgi:hypothetical protein